jgi:hypothetical protein
MDETHGEGVIYVETMPIIEKLMWLLASIVIASVGYIIKGFVQRVDNKVDKPTCELIQQREDAVLDGLKKDIVNLTTNVDKLTNEFGSKSVMVLDSVNKLLEEQSKPKRRKKS